MRAPRLLMVLLLGAAFSGCLSACVPGPAAEEAPTPELVKSKLDQADSQRKQNKLSDAKEIYEWALKVDATNGRAAAGLAMVYYDKGDLDSALKFAKQGSDNAGKEAGAHMIYGDVLSKVTKHSEAVVAYAKAAELAPKDAPIAMRHGTALLASGDAAQAETVLMKAAELDPEMQYVYAELGDALRAQEKLDDALRTYMKAQSLYKSDKKAHAGAALVYEKQGKYESSMDQWSAYIQLDCCSDFSNTVAKPKLEEVSKLEQAQLAAGGEG